MSAIRPIVWYIERTKMDKNDRYYLGHVEVFAMLEKAHQNGDFPLDMIALAFNYGKAKKALLSKRLLLTFFQVAFQPSPWRTSAPWSTIAALSLSVRASASLLCFRCWHGLFSFLAEAPNMDGPSPPLP